MFCGVLVLFCQIDHLSLKAQTIWDGSYYSLMMPPLSTHTHQNYHICRVTATRKTQHPHHSNHVQDLLTAPRK